MSWSKITLGDVIEIKHGFAFKSEFFSDVGNYILLTPGNCHESGGLKLKGAKEKFYLGDFPEEYLLSTGDLLVVMTDLVNTAPILGGTFIIPQSDKFLHNQRLGLIRITDETRISKKFLYYLLNTISYRGQVRGSASGVTVRHTSPDRIKRCKVRIPDVIKEQDHIASVLSAYDYLIENNRRRIALLERAARELYREWFVRLRFPGHENTKVINGVPEGWEREPLGEIAPLNYGKALKKDNRIPGPFPVYGSSGVIGTHEQAIVSGPAIVVGRKGNVGSIYWSKDDFFPIDTVYFIEAKHCSIYLYYSLLHTSFISTDVAVPGLNKYFAQSRQILVPNNKILTLFEQLATTIHEQIHRLEKYKQTLVKARDLLLPRLMNREVSI